MAQDKPATPEDAAPTEPIEHATEAAPDQVADATPPPVAAPTEHAAEPPSGAAWPIGSAPGAGVPIQSVQPQPGQVYAAQPHSAKMSPLRRLKTARPWTAAVVGSVAGVLVFCLGIGLGYAVGHHTGSGSSAITQIGPGGQMRQFGDGPGTSSNGSGGSNDGSGNALPQLPGGGASQDGQGGGTSQGGPNGFGGTADDSGGAQNS